MESKLAKQLLHLFFKAPNVNALLVFEKNEYAGIIFKRDVEIGISENSFNIIDNINLINGVDLPDLLFSHGVSSKLRIPVIDKAGNLIKIITHSEFECHFNFDSYIKKFELEPVLYNLDHPLVITSFFKKIVYMNKESIKMTGKDIQGEKITALLQSFEFELTGDKMIVAKGKDKYQLLINRSLVKNFSYIIYQFFLI